MMRKHHQQEDVRRYLLNQLSESKRQEIELRLLTDETFSEELEFVEDELIDEFLANELSARERAEFEKTFLAHPDRKRKLQEGQAFKRYFDAAAPVAKPSPPGKLESLRNWLSRFHISPPVAVAVSALVIAVIALVISRGRVGQSDLEQGLVALNEAYRSQRPVEARISNLNHSRFISTRGGNTAKNINEFQEQRAERFLQDAVEKRHDAASYQALGELYLLRRDPDKAIEYLERARQADPNNARIYSDLGAAYLEKGRPEMESSGADAQPDGKGIEYRGRSLDYLKQALELDPNLLEALFNLALVHEYQGLSLQAQSDWRAYLAKDASSPWAAEAQQRLKDLEDRTRNRSQGENKPVELFMLAYKARDDTTAWNIYSRKHTSGGNEVTNALLDRFLAEAPNNSPSEDLQALSYLGQLEFNNSQDVYTSDLARFYSSATPQARQLLLQARQAMAKGQQLLRESRIAKANDLFFNALKTFESAGDVPETLLAESAMAHGAAVEPNLVKGQEILARLVPLCESRHYKWLLAQSISLQAHIQSNLNNFSQGISDGSRALHLFRELNDMSSGTLETLVQLAILHLLLNDLATSRAYLSRAQIVASEGEAQATKIWGMYMAISLNLTALKLYRAALDYQNGALQLVLGSPQLALLRSRSYQYMGMSYASLKRFDLAVTNLQLAYEQGKPLFSEPNGKNMMANASLYLGDVYRTAGDPASALVAYEESSRLYEALGFYHYEYASHKGKFLAYWAQNNDAMASDELRVVVDLFEQYRKKILGERHKAFFFDREQDIYDLAIDFTYSRLHDELGAFDYSEACRARHLRELMKLGAEITPGENGLDLRAKGSKWQTISSLTAIEVKENLREGMQLVQFAVLKDKVLVWLISRAGIFSRPIAVKSAELDDLVATALKQIRLRDNDGATKSLKNLYALLIDPIREKLNPNLVLCIVPDKALHYVPFSALMSATNRYLAQDFRLIISPSATILIDSTENSDRRPSLEDERLLAVGNPSFDRKTNPDLNNLPAAQREVEEIAGNYNVPNVLITRRATRTSIMADLPQADVAHFAAHFQIDPRSNLLSQLLLAPELGERAHAQPSGLRSVDIYSLNLKRPRLVVLSGCDTGIEEQFGGEGPIGFARSFLVAGVPVVVASLWPVDSDATWKLMSAFHRNRKKDHMPTAEALMRAQQEMMSGNYRDAYFWAGFVVVGGYSNF